MELKKALELSIPMTSVNEPIHIFEGEMLLGANNIFVKISGSLRLEWLPKPEITFSGNAISEISMKDLRDIANEERIILETATGASGEALITQFNFGNASITGIMQNSIENSNWNMNYIKLSIVNFINTDGKAIGVENSFYRGRINFKYDKYKIIVDKLPDFKSRYEELKSSGGYIITHVSKIEDTSGNAIKIAEISDLIEGLSWFLSFMCGRKIGICSVHGYNQNNEITFERYESSFTSIWQSNQSWFPSKLYGMRGNEEVEKIFPLFLAKLNHPLWKDVLKQVFSWYFDSSPTLYIEQKVVAIQIALEMLAWAFIVEEKEIITRTKFNKSSASDNLRLMMGELEIPVNIPDIPEFESVPVKYEDGLHLFTSYRNEIVHITRKSELRSLPGWSTYYIAELGKKYLELSILNLLGYNGKYYNRLSTEKWTNKKSEDVPWK